jgi:hypothetical protein
MLEQVRHSGKPAPAAGPALQFFSPEKYYKQASN